MLSCGNLEDPNTTIVRSIHCLLSGIVFHVKMLVHRVERDHDDCLIASEMRESSGLQALSLLFIILVGLSMSNRDVFDIYHRRAALLHYCERGSKGS